MHLLWPLFQTHPLQPCATMTPKQRVTALLIPHVLLAKNFTMKSKRLSIKWLENWAIWWLVSRKFTANSKSLKVKLPCIQQLRPQQPPIKTLFNQQLQNWAHKMDAEWVVHRQQVKNNHQLQIIWLKCFPPYWVTQRQILMEQLH